MRFRTRSQEVEAVQWRGDNLEEVQALIPNVEREWEVESTLYVPVPDLIRTVADYEGLPDGTILKVVEAHGTMAVLKLDGYFRLTGVRGPYAAPTMAKRYVCSVVRLGGSQ